MILRGCASRLQRDAYPRGIARADSQGDRKAIGRPSGGHRKATGRPSEAHRKPIAWPSEGYRMGENEAWRFRVGTRPVTNGTRAHAESTDHNHHHHHQQNHHHHHHHHHYHHHHGVPKCLCLGRPRSRMRWLNQRGRESWDRAEQKSLYSPNSESEWGSYYLSRAMGCSPLSLLHANFDLIEFVPKGKT